MLPPFLRGSASVVVAASMLLSPVATALAAPSRIPPGTPVPLEFTREMSSRTAEKGDAVPLRVVEDVRVGGQVVIRRGAAAEGVVTKVHHRRSFGRKGELRIRLVRVRDVRGRYVPLEAYKTGHRFSAGGPGAAGGGLLVFGPLGLVAGAFVKGGEVTIHKGTRIQAEVAVPH